MNAVRAVTISADANPICAQCMTKGQAVSKSCFQGLMIRKRRRVKGCTYALEQLFAFQKGMDSDQNYKEGNPEK